MPSTPSKTARTWALVILGSLTMFAAMSTDMYLPSFPAAAHALGVHVVDMQLTLTSFLFGMGIGQVAYGPISDRYGRKRPLLVGIVVFIVASTMCAGSMVLFSFISSSPALLMGTYGVSRATFGLLFGLNPLAMVMASQVNIRLLPRLGVHALLRRFTWVQSVAAW